MCADVNWQYPDIGIGINNVEHFYWGTILLTLFYIQFIWFNISNLYNYN